MSKRGVRHINQNSLVQCTEQCTERSINLQIEGNSMNEHIVMTLIIIAQVSGWAVFFKLGRVHERVAWNRDVVPGLIEQRDRLEDLNERFKSLG